jgi:hypothetical protein
MAVLRHCSTVSYGSNLFMFCTSASEQRPVLLYVRARSMRLQKSDVMCHMPGRPDCLFKAVITVLYCINISHHITSHHITSRTPSPIEYRFPGLFLTAAIPPKTQPLLSALVRSCPLWSLVQGLLRTYDVDGHGRMRIRISHIIAWHPRGCSD